MKTTHKIFLVLTLSFFTFFGSTLLAQTNQGGFFNREFNPEEIAGIIKHDAQKVIKKLKITKQSLNRVLKDLIKLETIFFEKGQKDTRLKHIFLNEKGEKIFEEVFSAQKKRIYAALLNSSSDQVLNFNSVLKKIINE